MTNKLDFGYCNSNVYNRASQDRIVVPDLDPTEPYTLWLELQNTIGLCAKRPVFSLSDVTTDNETMTKFRLLRQDGTIFMERRGRFEDGFMTKLDGHVLRIGLYTVRSAFFRKPGVPVPPAMSIEQELQELVANPRSFEDFSD